MSEPKDTAERIVNRHMARTLCQLEDAGCAAIFIEAVKTNMAWLRKDLNDLLKDDERDDTQEYQT